MARTVFESQTIAGMRIQKRVKVMPKNVPTHVTVMAFIDKPQIMKRCRATFKHFKMDYWTLHASIRSKFNVPVDKQCVVEALSDDGKYIHLTNQEDLIFSVMTSPAGATLVLRISIRAPSTPKRQVRLAPLVRRQETKAAVKHYRVNAMGSFFSNDVKPYEIEDDRLPSFVFVMPVKTMFRVNKLASFIPNTVAVSKKTIKRTPFAAFMTGRVAPSAAAKTRKCTPRGIASMFIAEPAKIAGATQTTVVRHNAKVQCAAKMADAETQTPSSAFKTTSRPTNTPIAHSVSVGCTAAIGMDAIEEEDLAATLVPNHAEEEDEMIESVMAWNCVVNEESKGYKLAVAKTMQNEEEAAGYDFADM